MGDRVFLLFGTIAHNIFWGIGYFVGFTLVGLMTLGAFTSAPFTDIGKWADHKFWRIIYRDNGRCYVVGEVVAMIGWLALSLLAWSVAGWRM